MSEDKLRQGKYLQSIENLERTLANLTQACAKKNPSDLELTGGLKYFELCYELSWKTLKKVAEPLGRNIATPKEAFRYALEAGLIPVASEQIWLDMIVDRNLSVHVYDRSSAEKVFKNVSSRYVGEISQLVGKIRAL